MKKNALTALIYVVVFIAALTAALCPGCNPIDKHLASAAESSSLQAQESYDVPIIMYHSVYPLHASKYSITPAMLDEDLAYLKKQGYEAVGINSLIEYQEKGMPLPKKPIIITFDDGYANNYYHAFPVLKKHNMKAVYSVVGKLIDDNYVNGKYVPTGAHVSYEQIKKLHESGLIEIQNHTYNMHNLKGGRVSMKRKKNENIEQYEQAISADLMKLQNNLNEKLGITPTALTIPFGAYSKEAFEIVKKLGFKAVLTCNAGINKISRNSDLFHLKRFNRSAGNSSKNFFAGINIQ